MIAILIFPLMAGVRSVSAQQVKGPAVDTVKFVQYSDPSIALSAVKSGDIDAYLYPIPVDSVPDASKDPSLSIYSRDAGSFGLLINPAPANNSNTLNPFQFRQIRFAMNDIVDRDFMVSGILKGFGAPMVDPFGTSSPEYLSIVDIVQSFGFRHDLSIANNTITPILTNAGATLENGKWMYKGSPVSINFFIRSDDPRRNAMGQAISADLEKLGFTVNRSFGDLAKATTDVYSSNPQDLKWQLYTEGYAGTAVFVAYNPTVTTQMYAPWYGNMPGRGNPGFWQYHNKTLDEVTQKILNLNFSSKAERTQLVRSAVEMGIQESVRIFIAQTKEPYVASSSVSGLVNDFGAGISSRLSFIDAKPGSRNDFNVGVRQISQGAWNNVEGLKDTFSITLASPVVDFADARDPYLGTVIPDRLTWSTVQTQGPHGHLSVPQDAVVWNPVTSQWKPVGNNATAETEVTFKALYSNWHNGIPMDKNDLLYSYYFPFQWGTNTTSSGKPWITFDPEFSPAAQGSLPTVKGIKFLSNDTFESYIDQWHFDSGELADAATVWPAEPWEITAAQERLVEAGKVAFSSTGAQAKSIDWLSLVNPSHAQLILSELTKMKSEQYIPPALKGLVTPAQANARYDASMQWIAAHNHAVISDGPFYLDTFNAAGQTATLKAFRDSTYPFPQGYWASQFGTPQIATIKSIDTSGPVAAGQPKSILVSVDIAGSPSNDANVSYFISGPTGVVASGYAVPTNTAGQFNVTLDSNQTSKLPSGANTFKAIAIGNKAFKLAVSSVPLLVSGGTPEFPVASLILVSAIVALVAASRAKIISFKR